MIQDGVYMDDAAISEQLGYVSDNGGTDADEQFDPLSTSTTHVHDEISYDEIIDVVRDLAEIDFAVYADDEASPSASVIEGKYDSRGSRAAA